MKKQGKIMKIVLAVATIVWLVSILFFPDKSWGVLVKSALSLVELFLILFTVKEKNNILKVVLITIFALAIFSWILPAASFSGEYMDQGRIQIGLFDLFNYMLTSTSYFGYIALFVIVVGGFYGILYKIPAYRSFLDKIVVLFKGKEALALSIIMVLLAVITSICGLQLGLILFFPMIAAVILLMGYDKIVVALTLVGSTMIGVAGTTFGYSNISLTNNVLGLDIMDNILIKVIILLVGLVLLIYNTIMYAKFKNSTVKSAVKASKKVVKIEKETNKEEVKPNKSTSKKTSKKTTGTNKKSAAKKDAPVKKVAVEKKTAAKTTVKKSTSKKKTTSKSSRKDIKAASKGEDVIVVKESLVNDSIDKFVPTVVDSKHKIWPIITAFTLLFVIMIMAFIPWGDSFGLTAFEVATEAVLEFEIFKFPIFGKLLGTVNAFGAWSITDMIIVIAFVTMLLVFVYKVKIDDVFEGFANGVKKALLPAFMVLFVYLCLVITTYHPYQLAIYKGLLEITKGFNVVTTILVTILSSLFNQDPAYVAQAVLPYFTSLVTDASAYPIVGTMFQSIYGVSMLVAPTGLILVTVLSYLDITYKEWMKAIWKLLLEFFVILLIVFLILIFV